MISEFHGTVDKKVKKYYFDEPTEETNTSQEQNNNQEQNKQHQTETQIAEYTTKIYTKDSNRQNNLSIACSTLNGTTVENKATFSLSFFRVFLWNWYCSGQTLVSADGGILYGHPQRLHPRRCQQILTLGLRARSCA